MNDRPVALVTGGARRLGRDIVLELAAAGWNVAVALPALGRRRARDGKAGE